MFYYEGEKLKFLHNTAIHNILVYERLMITGVNLEELAVLNKQEDKQE